MPFGRVTVTESVRLWEESAAKGTLMRWEAGWRLRVSNTSGRLWFGVVAGLPLLSSVGLGAEVGGGKQAVGALRCAAGGVPFGTEGIVKSARARSRSRSSPLAIAGGVQSIRASSVRQKKAGRLSGQPCVRVRVWGRMHSRARRSLSDPGPSLAAGSSLLCRSIAGSVTITPRRGRAQPFFGAGERGGLASFSARPLAFVLRVVLQ